MAQRVETTFIDDIDGSVAERTFTFAVDGTQYAIDLSSENIREFNEAIAGFVESSRKLGKLTTTSNGRPRSNGTVSVRASREHLAVVRAWLRQQGEDVSDRGRISAENMAKFDAAH